MYIKVASPTSVRYKCTLYRENKVPVFKSIDTGKPLIIRFFGLQQLNY
jgi:hypothetical protein